MIKDRNIDPDAQIAGSKVALTTDSTGFALASAKVLIGNASGIAKPLTLSGDVTNDNAGVTAIGAGKVTNAMVSPAALDGTVAKVVANVNVIGGLPVIHRITLADTGAATTNTDVTLTHKTMILDAWSVKTAAAAGNAGASTLRILSTASAITDALSIRNVADTAITRFTQINDANQTIAAGGVLRVEQVLADGNDDNACEVYVLGIRVT